MPSGFLALGALKVEVLGNLKLDAVPVSGSADISTLGRASGQDRGRFSLPAASVKGRRICGGCHQGGIFSDSGSFRPRGPAAPQPCGAHRPARSGTGTYLVLESEAVSPGACHHRHYGGVIQTLRCQRRCLRRRIACGSGRTRNILEPIAWGIPTIHGPHMDNFAWAIEGMKGLTMVVRNPSELAAAVTDLIKDGRGREMAGALGRRSMRPAA